MQYRIQHCRHIHDLMCKLEREQFTTDWNKRAPLISSSSQSATGGGEKEKEVAQKDMERAIQTLTHCRFALEYLPQNYLGTASEHVELPSGEDGEMKWPIRDELIDEINKSIAALRSASVKEK